jgi:glycosyltransferase involved in cell wall biosynthesis
MLPRITIVTPSFNQAQYLEQTILSVLDQGYENLEYIIIDGGSTDGSADIIRKYESRLKYWVSERDRGQTHAINKGMALATGAIRAYLNSDDFYLPGTLHAVAKAATECPDADLFHGVCRIVDNAGNRTGFRNAKIHSLTEILDVWGVWWRGHNFVQPEVFWTERIAQQIGPLREDLFFVMDYEYWTRMLKAGASVCSAPEEWACFRITPTQKSTHAQRASDELLSVLREYLWNPEVKISPADRRRFQGDYLYQTQFLPTVARCVEQKHSRARRTQHILKVISVNPQILRSRGFWGRIKAVRNGRLS